MGQHNASDKCMRNGENLRLSTNSSLYLETGTRQTHIFYMYDRWIGSRMGSIKCQHFTSLHFAWGVTEAKCILVTAVCVCLSLAAFPHYCTDPCVSWRNDRGCPLVVQYWAHFPSVYGFRCYDNIAPNGKCHRVLVLSLCLFFYIWRLPSYLWNGGS